MGRVFGWAIFRINDLVFSELKRNIGRIRIYFRFIPFLIEKFLGF